MANDKFERIEKKFWMNEFQYRKMMEVLDEHMSVDQYGQSTIRNVYCDSDDYYLIRKSIEQPQFKEKLRIRSYGHFEDNAKVFVEIKRKVCGIGYKRRIQITYSDAKKLLEGQHINCYNPQIENEILEFVKRYHPKQKVYLTYDRVAMYGKEDPDQRITIDRNIRYEIYEEGKPFGEGKTIMTPESCALMEVKLARSMPDWLIDSLSQLHIYQASFSKIGTCFTKFIAPTLTIGGNNPREIKLSWQKSVINSHKIEKVKSIS